MDSITADRRLSAPDDRGVTSVQFLLASVLGLVLFLALANLVVVQYGRGAIRTALDQGARVGAVTGSPVECADRVQQVLGELLGGSMGDRTVTSCRIGDHLVTARGTATFESWTPFAGDFEVDLSSEASLEGIP